MGEFRGYISREHTVWCGVCGNWEQTADGIKKEAERYFRKNGWRYTEENGWTCPKCLGKKS